MSKKLYVGNIPFQASEDDLMELFAKHGAVDSINLIKDRFSGKPRGFGFVEMEQEGAEAAIEALNGTDFQGRKLVVNEARERRERRGGGGGGGGGDRRRRKPW